MLIKLQVVAVMKLESCNNRDSLEINCNVNEGRQSDTYPQNLKGEIMWLKKVKYKEADWEEVPTEDLWEDGELDSEQVKEKLYQEVIRQGVWKLIRRKDD